MADRSFNEVLATGNAYIDYDPLGMLKQLSASVGYHGEIGYCIVLSDAMRARLHDVILFNTGGDTLPTAPKAHGGRNGE